MLYRCYNVAGLTPSRPYIASPSAPRLSAPAHQLSLTESSIQGPDDCVPEYSLDANMFKLRRLISDIRQGIERVGLRMVLRNLNMIYSQTPFRFRGYLVGHFGSYASNSEAGKCHRDRTRAATHGRISRNETSQGSRPIRERAMTAKP